MAQHTPQSCDPPSKRQRIQAFSTPPNVDSVVQSLSKLSVTPKRAQTQEPKSRRRLVYTVEDQLSPKNKLAMPAWSEEEYTHLVEYLMLYTDGKSWISEYQNFPFWNGAGKFVQSRVHSVHCRSGISHLFYLTGNVTMFSFR